jgi:hypothetical protein
MLMLHVHVLVHAAHAFLQAACPCYMSTLPVHINITCLCKYRMSMLLEFSACQRCMPELHVHAAHPFCVSLLHVMLFVHVSWHCCMSLLHVHPAFVVHEHEV